MKDPYLSSFPTNEPLSMRITIMTTFVKPCHFHPGNSPMRNPILQVEKLLFRIVKFHAQDHVDRKQQRCH